MTDRLFRFFNEELEALRGLGGRFAARYPKIAGRLRLSAEAIDDPHVARLIESFAFIASRLRLKLDDDFPELTETLLEFLYPHYLAPIPSLCITSFVSNSEVTGRTVIQRGTVVESEESDGDICYFRTTQDIELWPVKVAQVSMSGRPLIAPPAPRLDALASIRLVLECTDPDVTFTDLGIDRLRFYLHGPWNQAVNLYELLLNDCIMIGLADDPEDQNPVLIGPEAIQPIGFDASEAALPAAPRGHPAFRLLTEFFAFPHKFLFVELSGLGAKTLRLTGNRMEVFFYLRRHVVELERAISANMFALGCTPIINLFDQRAEPILLNRAETEYAIVPDSRHHETREVYSIDSVRLAESGGASRDATPLFVCPIGQEGLVTLHWQLRRRCLVEGDGSTDARLALVDTSASLHTLSDSALIVQTTCLNRDLAARLPYGGGHPILNVPRCMGGTGRLVALSPFTSTLRLPRDEGLLWRLLSHLKLSHLSLVDDQAGPDAFREMLRLYDFRDSPETRTLINAVDMVKSHRSTARIHGGLARGLDITVEIDLDSLERGAAFLFGQLLDRFLGLYVNLNSFTRLTLRLKDVSQPVKTWAPRSGARVIL